MKNYEKEYPVMKHEDSHYRRNHKRAWGDERFFSFEDMQNFWDRAFDRENHTDQPNVR